MNDTTTVHVRSEATEAPAQVPPVISNAPGSGPARTASETDTAAEPTLVNVTVFVAEVVVICWSANPTGAASRPDASLPLTRNRLVRATDEPSGALISK